MARMPSRSVLLALVVLLGCGSPSRPVQAPPPAPTPTKPAQAEQPAPAPQELNLKPTNEGEGLGLTFNETIRDIPLGELANKSLWKNVWRVGRGESRFPELRMLTIEGNEDNVSSVNLMAARTDDYGETGLIINQSY